MNRIGLALASIRHYRRAWLGVLAGSALTCMIITGALLVGDSARHTLLNIAVQRIGLAEYAMAPRDGFFGADLDKRLSSHDKLFAASILRLRGIAIAGEHESRSQLNNIQVLGVDARFWDFTEEYALDSDKIGINQRLADDLGVTVGDELALRIEVPSRFARDAPLSSRGEELTRRRLFSIDAIVPDEHLGRFSLETNQRAPYTVFVDRARLQEVVDLPGTANIMLLRGLSNDSIDGADVDARLSEVSQAQDFGIYVREYPQFGVAQIESDSVYLPPAATHAGAGTRISTYMVNTISAADRSTPYSFVNAVEPSADNLLSPVPSDMRDDQILVNRWLADTLDVSEGDTVTIEYYSLLPNNELRIDTAHLEVYGIVKMDDISAERELVPDFPGLTDVDSCANWSIGLPLEEELLEDQDNEQYWEDYRATPKAFITFEQGRLLWGNRFGETTAVRMLLDDAESKRADLDTAIAPSELGFFFTPVRQEALQAVDGAVDLGQLFLGMSFFLVLSSLLIIAFLFSLALRQRISQCGIMLASGFTRTDVTALMLAEALVIALVGAALGSFAGFAYTRALIHGLSSGWSGAVAGAALDFHFTLASPLYAVAATVLSSAAVMLFTAPRLMSLPPNAQLRGDVSSLGADRPRRRGIARVVMWIAVFAGASIVAKSLMSQDLLAAANSFFVAGFLFLLAALLFVRDRLQSCPERRSRFTVARLTLNNLKRRGNHSLGVVALLACGSFLVFAVSAMRENLELRAGERSSGTGGFDLFATSTIPMLDNPGEADTQRELRIEDAGLRRVIPIRVRDGDDLSCLNLNQALAPTLLGVDPRELDELGAFVSPEKESVWDMLEIELDDGAIPAIAGDSDTLTWGLNMRAGITDGGLLEYTDSSGGRVAVRIVATLPLRLTALHGNLIISKENFNSLFPSENGYRMFLIDIDDGVDLAEAQDILAARLERIGFESVPTIERLRLFYQIESAYLSIFLMLGGFGMVLAAAGMATIVWRNIAERGREIEILSAIGFERGQIRLLLTAEYILLLLTGLACGIICALIAVAPNFIIPGSAAPWSDIFAVMASIAISGALFISASVIIATRGRIAVPEKQD